MRANTKQDELIEAHINHQNQRQINTDLMWVVLITVATYLVAAYFDLAERYIDWTALGEIYQLDEIIFVLLAGCAALIWFSIRRIRALTLSLADNLHMQARLQNSNDNIRRLLNDNKALIKHLIEVRESERQHLAAELHNVFGQHLAAMDANLTVALNTPQEKTLKPILYSVLESTNHLRNITRQKLRQLKPPNLDNLGLSGAVHELLHDWANEAKTISLDSRIDLNDKELDAEVAMTLYRALQEGLSNIGQHADATEVFVDISQFRENGQHQLQLLLEDNGRGLPAGYDEKGLGLLALKEHAESHDGQLTLTPGLTSGTRLQLKLSYLPLI